MSLRFGNAVHALVLVGFAAGCGGANSAVSPSEEGIDASVSTCYGMPLPCSDRIGSECTSSSGCFPTSTCAGEATPCILTLTEFQCTSQQGCFWDSTSSRCSGSVTPCSLIFAGACSEQDGCQEGSGCDGIAQPCGSYSEDDCALQPGCSWGTPPPPQTGDASTSDAGEVSDATVGGPDAGAGDSGSGGGCSTNADCASMQNPNLCDARLTCQGGACLPDPSTAVHCDPSQDTACKKNTCSPSTGQCSMADQPNGTFCDDGVYCTTGDSCEYGNCVGGPSPCTNPCETCDETSKSCVAAAGLCEIQGACYSSGELRSGYPCQSCQPAVSQTGWSPVAQGVACSIYDACQVSTVCDGAGTCSGPPLTPPVPALWSPRAGALTGSLLAPSSAMHLRPVFTWRQPKDACSTLPAYDIQIDDSCPATGFQSCTFPSPEASATGLLVPQFQPASDLPVSTVQPVGRRYYWHVRACRGTSCSAWSSVSYVDVGRARIDVNGDGYSDLIATQLGEDNDLGEGTVYAYLGSSTGVKETPDITMDALLPGQQQYFGRILRTGDLNGDGFADLVIAAPSAFQDTTQSMGVVYVYYGGASGVPSAPSATLVSPVSAKSLFGHALAAAGDVDADGFADLAVAAPCINATDPVALVYAGSPSGIDVTASKYSLMPSMTQGNWVAAIATEGDLNGDAIADIVVAGAGNFVYDGSSSGSIGSPMSLMTFLINFDPWPEVLSTAADLDGNGYADLLYQGEDQTNLMTRKGVMEFYSYGYPLTKYAFMASNPKNDQNDFQAAFATGNFDGTGPVIAVGSLSSQFINGGVGYVYLFKPAATSPFATLTSPTPATGQTFGTGVQNVGDLNGDGYDDLAVGEPFGGTANAGNTYVLYGSTTGLPANPSVTLVSPRAGQSAYENFGVTFAQ